MKKLSLLFIPSPYFPLLLFYNHCKTGTNECVTLNHETTVHKDRFGVFMLMVTGHCHSIVIPLFSSALRPTALPTPSEICSVFACLCFSGW